MSTAPDDWQSDGSTAKLIRVNGFANNSPPYFDYYATGFVTVNESPNVSDEHSIVATDVDSDTLTYSLDAASDVLFDIDSTGALAVSPSASIDFETAETYYVTVSVSDGKALNGSADASVDASLPVTVYVSNDWESPSTPAAPTLTVGGDHVLAASWSAPTTSGPPINDYDVRFRESGETTWSNWNSALNSIATSTTITGLTSGTAYEVQVKADTAEGDSEWSASATATTSGEPPPEATVSKVELVSTPTADVDGDNTAETYKLGDVVRARVTFSRAVGRGGQPGAAPSVRPALRREEHDVRLQRNGHQHHDARVHLDDRQREHLDPGHRLLRQQAERGARRQHQGGRNRSPR